jgi:serine protease
VIGSRLVPNLEHRITMARQRHRVSGRLAAGGVVLLGVVAAACQPVAPPPAPPPTTAGCPAASQASPTPEHPVSYAVVVRRLGWASPQVTSFTATSTADESAQVAALQSSGTVLAVGPNQTVTAQTDPGLPSPTSYPDWGLQWGLHPAPGADFQPAWSAGDSGTGETVAVVDTGVDLSHQGLAGRVVAGPDFIAGGPVTGDPNGHGTHVAGIVADHDPLGGLGGAPNATILAVRVLDASGSGTDATVAAGILWAAAHGANVINLSLGAPACDTVLASAVQTAESEGVVVVAAAGNDGSTELFSPAADTTQGVIAVAAIDDTGTKASWSNDGPFVALAAPGVTVLSTCAWTSGSGNCISSEGGTTPTDTAYGYLSGTSMAAPFVSAAAALVKEECPSFSPSQVKAELVNHAGAAVPGQVFHQLDAGAAVSADCH